MPTKKFHTISLIVTLVFKCKVDFSVITHFSLFVASQSTQVARLVVMHYLQSKTSLFLSLERAVTSGVIVVICLGIFIIS